MKKFYFQLEDDIITDVIEYPHDGYIEVELNLTHLPPGINAKYYRLNNNVFVLDEDLKSIVDIEMEKNESMIDVD